MWTPTSPSQATVSAWSPPRSSERARSTLVNNAAIAGRHSKPLVDTDDVDWDAMMAVNLRGPFLLCRAAVRQMLAQPLHDEVRGRIVNITSQHGMVGCPGHFSYSVSKGGLVQMTRQIAVEHANRRRASCNFLGRAGQDRDGHARRPQRKRRRPVRPTYARARRSLAWAAQKTCPPPSPSSPARPPT